MAVEMRSMRLVMSCPFGVRVSGSGGFLKFACLALVEGGLDDGAADPGEGRGGGERRAVLDILAAVNLISHAFFLLQSVKGWRAIQRARRT